jgi:hypothetical protein
MGLNEGGVRTGGLRNLSEIGGIPDSVTNQWPWNEGSGTTLNDAVGGINATLNGGTWVSDNGSEGGYHIDFNGSSDNWTTDSAVGLDGAEMTMMQWVNMDTLSSSNDRVLTYGDSTDDNVIQLVTTGDGFGVYYYRSGGFNDPNMSVGGLSTGTWYLLAFVGYSNDDADLYVYESDSLAGSASGSFGRNFLSDDKLTGMSRRQGDINADGQADAPAISNDTAMSQSEIEQYRDSTR